MAKTKQAKAGNGAWGNGSIVQRGDRWRARWREAGRQHEASYPSRAEAVDALQTIQARLQLGQPGQAVTVQPEPANAATVKLEAFHDLLDAWVEYRQRFDVRTAAAERARWALHLARPLETQTVRGVSPKWVIELAAELVRPTVGSKAPDGSPKQAVSGPTAQRILTQLSSFFAWAVREGHATTNPAAIALTDRGLKRLLEQRSTDAVAKVPLRSWAEVDRLQAGIARTSEVVSIWFMLQSRCGLRPGEATGQLWADVDLDGAKLLVRGSVRHGHYDQTKGGKVRVVPLTPTAVAALRAWRQSCPGASGLVCPSEVEGAYLGFKAISRALGAGFRAAKLDPRTPYEAGRVTFATLVGGSGKVSAFTLQKWMGHADVKTTEAYVKAQPGLSAGELAALGG